MTDRLLKLDDASELWRQGPTMPETVTARPLIIDIFADYTLHRDGEVTALALTRLAQEFGVADTTMRMMISRMRKERWLESRRRGRMSYYGATSQLTTFIESGAERILERRVQSWDRRWDMVQYTIPETDRKRRDHLRSKLEWLGYGQFAPGCWMSPHRRNDAVLPALDDECEIAPEEIEMFEVTSSGEDRDRAIAAQCWQLEALHADYEEFQGRRQQQLSRLRASPIADNAAFVQRVLLVYEYRKFPFRDPDLPTELLPDRWIGRSAHATFVELRELLRVPAFRFYDAQP